MSFNIRPYHPSDLTALYRICLKTGNSGTDATGLYKDPDILGQFYAAPYAVLEPELCFIATKEDIPSGYILGTRDSKNFYQQCEKEWFPVLRKRYPLPAIDDESPDARIIRLIHQGQVTHDDLVDYPAHLHIDLLPNLQGQGMGRKLIETFAQKLKVMGVAAVHLQVGKKNEGAVKFYKRVGFHIIKEYEFVIAFGMNLV